MYKYKITKMTTINSMQKIKKIAVLTSIQIDDPRPLGNVILAK
jgi:hypothetical protein